LGEHLHLPGTICGTVGITRGTVVTLSGTVVTNMLDNTSVKHHRRVRGGWLGAHLDHGTQFSRSKADVVIAHYDFELLPPRTIRLRPLCVILLHDAGILNDALELIQDRRGDKDLLPDDCIILVVAVVGIPKLHPQHIASFLSPSGIHKISNSHVCSPIFFATYTHRMELEPLDMPYWAS
jgi:hypothetical protein